MKRWPNLSVDEARAAFDSGDPIFRADFLAWLNFDDGVAARPPRPYVEADLRSILYGEPLLDERRLERVIDVPPGVEVIDYVLGDEIVDEEKQTKILDRIHKRASGQE